MRNNNNNNASQHLTIIFYFNLRGICRKFDSNYNRNKTLNKI